MEKDFETTLNGMLKATQFFNNEGQNSFKDKMQESIDLMRNYLRVIGYTVNYDWVNPIEPAKGFKWYVTKN